MTDFNNYPMNDEEMSERKTIDFKKIQIGQWADYLDTGIWDMKDGVIVAPQDVTIEQLKDFLRISGGVVYLRQDGRFGWGWVIPK